jgi:hypothetical protein
VQYLELLPGLLDGINYNTADATKATLVLDAPLKFFIYVAEVLISNLHNAYSMKRSYIWKFWLELQV